jgi:methionyl-tRNA formyltransferase
MPNSVLLLGGTDVTLAVAQAVHDSGVQLKGIVAIGDSFSISYSATQIQNVRNADLIGWAQQNDVDLIPFTTYEAVLDRFSGEIPAVCLVAGWYHMVPRRFRGVFTHGCFGFHASLLPKLRGGAPLNWAILSGSKETGVTLFEMADGVDTGLMFGQERFPITPRATIGELVAASRDACATLTRRHLRALLDGSATGRPQEGEASYGLQRTPSDGRIIWGRPRAEIDRLVRAVSRPYPGAFTLLGDERIHIWSTQLPEEAPLVLGSPGQLAILPQFDLPSVVTGDGLLLIAEATGADGNDCLDKLRKAGHKRFDTE